MSAATVALPAPIDRSRVRVIFAGLMLVLLLAALDQTIVATALPTIVGDLGGLDRLAWVTSAFLLAQTAVTPIYGKLGDLYGRKRVLQSAIVLFLIGSALCGQANGMTELVAFRAVQGLGAGGLIVLVQAVIGDIVPPRERGRYQGLFGAVFGVASVAGPLLGGSGAPGAAGARADRQSALGGTRCIWKFRPLAPDIGWVAAFSRRGRWSSAT